MNSWDPIYDDTKVMRMMRKVNVPRDGGVQKFDEEIGHII